MMNPDVLPLAVKAQIPLISVETDDPMNAVLVLSEVTGLQCKSFPTTKGDGITKGKTLAPDAMVEGNVYVIRNADVAKLPMTELYKAANDKDCVVVFVNPSANHHALFDAGVMTCPPSLVTKFVVKHTPDDLDEEDQEAMVAALSGLSYKAMVELSLLSQAKHGVMSGRTLRDVRRMLFGSIRGLQQEDTESAFYQPDDEIAKWVTTGGKLFLHGKHAELNPRGLLLDGPPGTGKTEAAKFLARSLDLPLYRLDIAGGMNKWVGESEKAIQRALTQVDQCGPCVMLIDETEKLFHQGGYGDSGTSTRILSQMLWWLQEHKSKVFTVMTTNNAKVIPPELVRPGRLDRKLTLGLMQYDEALPFMTACAASMAHIAPVTTKELEKLREKLFPSAGAEGSSHAAITVAVKGLIKAKYLETL